MFDPPRDCVASSAEEAEAAANDYRHAHQELDREEAEAAANEYQKAPKKLQEELQR